MPFSYYSNGEISGIVVKSEWKLYYYDEGLDAIIYGAIKSHSSVYGHVSSRSLQPKCVGKFPRSVVFVMPFLLPSQLTADWLKTPRFKSLVMPFNSTHPIQLAVPQRLSHRLLLLSDQIAKCRRNQFQSSSSRLPTAYRQVNTFYLRFKLIQFLYSQLRGTRRKTHIFKAFEWTGIECEEV